MLHLAKPRETLAKSVEADDAQFVLRTPRKPPRTESQGNATLNTLRFGSEIRPADELRLPVN